MIRALSRRSLNFLISLYQLLLSPARGFFRLLSPNQCRYVPSCSNYGKLAVNKHGALKGSLKALYRILRCHPWGKGGIDLP